MPRRSTAACTRRSAADEAMDSTRARARRRPERTARRRAARRARPRRQGASVALSAQPAIGGAPWPARPPAKLGAAATLTLARRPAPPPPRPRAAPNPRGAPPPATRQPAAIMPLVYALVARATDGAVLAQHATVGGNFEPTARARINTARDAGDERFTTTADGYTYHFLVSGGYVFCVAADEASGRQVPFACCKRICDAWTEVRRGAGAFAAALICLRRARAGRVAVTSAPCARPGARRGPLPRTLPGPSSSLAPLSHHPPHLHPLRPPEVLGEGPDRGPRQHGALVRVRGPSARRQTCTRRRPRAVPGAAACHLRTGFAHTH